MIGFIIGFILGGLFSVFIMCLLISNHKGTDLNYEVEILEEKKKIPEKLKIEQDTPTSNYYIRNENGTKCSLTKHSKMIVETVNQLIDYLKSKGE